MVNPEASGYASKQDAQKEKQKNNFENLVEGNEKESDSFEFDFENAEEFIENNFIRTEKRVEKEGLRYNLIEFRPKSEEIKEWIKKRTHYLFCGNGNYSGDKSLPKELKNSVSDDSQKYSNETVFGNKLKNELKENPHEVMVKFEQAINSINGFLKSIGKENLAGYYTSTICGENGAYAAKKMMENGEDMEEKTAEIISQKKGLWIMSQLSTYAPYISTLFLRRDISEMDEWKNEVEESYKNLIGDSRLEFDKLNVDEKEIMEIAKRPSKLGVSALRDLHSLVYSKQCEIYKPVIVNKGLPNKYGECEELSRLIGQDRFAFSLMKDKNRNIYSGDAGIGWTIPEKGKVSDITDFAMITGKEFYEDGVVKFMIIEH